jgi:pimeloyl-ACP methyl ester carboxylesterase
VSGDPFSEGHVDAGGVRVRYCEAGQGPALLHVQAGEAPDVSAAHGLLARRFRVVVVATPPGCPPALIAGVLKALGLETSSVMGTGATAVTALALVLHAPAQVTALVLDTPEALEPALERRLPEVATPTLILAGTRDAAAAGPARACRARLPNSHLVYVYDAGPALGADRPAALAEVVGDFLARGEAFVISDARTVINP